MKDVKKKCIDLLCAVTARSTYVSVVLKVLKKTPELLSFVYAKTVGVT